MCIQWIAQFVSLTVIPLDTAAEKSPLLALLAVTLSENSNGQRALETSRKIKKDGGRSAENSRTFLEIFFAFSNRLGLMLNSEKNKTPDFIVLLGLKDCDGFHKGRR